MFRSCTNCAYTRDPAKALTMSSFLCNSFSKSANTAPSASIKNFVKKENGRYCLIEIIFTSIVNYSVHKSLLPVLALSKLPLTLHQDMMACAEIRVSSVPFQFSPIGEYSCVDLHDHKYILYIYRSFNITKEKEASIYEPKEEG